MNEFIIWPELVMLYSYNVAATHRSTFKSKNRKNEKGLKNLKILISDILALPLMFNQPF